MASFTATIDRVAELYHRGLYLQAYQVAEEAGPLTQWTDTAARVLAGRLATVLGAPRLGRILHGLAYRNDPQDPRVQYFYMFGLARRRGPLAAWRKMRHIGELPDAEPNVRADWFALHAETLALLRDFEAAEQWIERALDLTPERAWIWVEKSAILEVADQQEEALEAARHALELRPWYRPAVQSVAYRLVQLNRDDEALQLLGEATERLEAGDVLAQLAALETELEQYEEARKHFDALEQLYPLARYDKQLQKWLYARRADAAYYCGDVEQAAALARQVGTPFFDLIAERLAGQTDGKRVVLPVAYVRQHHLTCAPATLSAISGYWSRRADQLEVAEKICYDGTPAHSERRWAEQNGFVAREFRVTWPTATALIDRGVPFTLTTVDPGSAHLQAAIGYDARRGTLLIRDPSERHVSEFAAEKMLEHYRSTGPRGMTMVPEEEADRLDGIELPEAELYDLYYQMELALEAHQRDRAHQIHTEMRRLDPNHRLTLRARGNLANYDGNLSDLLVCTEQLLSKFPDDVNLLHCKLNCLTELGRRDDRLQLLERLCRHSEYGSFFWIRLAQELAYDARRQQEAIHWLKRAIRVQPLNAGAYALMAELLWDRQRRDEALLLYRFAACMDDRNETRAKAYFQASRHLRQTNVALRLLQDRFRRFGARSSWPVRTLCWAYEQLERAPDAFKTLEQAMQWRPNDGELLLFAADFYGRYGKHDESQQLLARAKANSHHTHWLRTAATLAACRGELREALEHWQQVLEAEPLACDAHESAAALLADLQGQQAAIDHLRQAVDQFPHHYTLHTLLIEWLRDEDPAISEAALQRFLASHPTDPWGHRELAIVLTSEGRWDDALAEVELAGQLDPATPVVPYIRGRIYQALGRLDEAREQYRQALRISVDYDQAIASLIETCDTKADRQRQLEFVHQQLKEQVTFGDGLLTYRHFARSTLEPERLLATLHEALDARPDLWHAWSAMIHQLTEMQRYDEALHWAQKGVERFPLLPRLWIDLAQVCRARGDVERQIEALQRASQINPSWGEPARQLAEAYQEQGQLERARAVLERAVAREPRDVYNHGSLAQVLWQLGQQQQAAEQLEHAIRLQPGFQWAWDQLRSWCDQLGQPDRVVQLARRLTEVRPREVRSWLILADVLDAPEQCKEACEAIQRALELDPRNADAYSLWAFYLARSGRFNEALAACHPDVFGDQLPLQLAARSAWVQSQQGNLSAAIEQMRRVVELDPDYYSAWQQLADWYMDDSDAQQQLLEAASQMVRLAPDYVVAWNYYGEALRRAGNREEAKAAFQRATTLDGEASFAASSLFDMQLEDGELDAAASTLAATAARHDPATLLAMHIRLDAARQQLDEAMQKLQQLCEMSLSSADALDLGVAALREAGLEREVEQLLAARVGEADTDRQVGWAWAGLHTSQLQWQRCQRKLRRIRLRGAAWHAACQRLINDLASAGRADLLQSFISKHRRTLREDNDSWAAAGEALVRTGRNRPAARWMADWQQRTDLTPTMVFPLVVALWGLRRPRKAAVVVEQLLALPPDGSTSALRVWAAMYELLYGDVPRAAEHLRQVDRFSMSGYYVDLLLLATALADGLSHGPQQLDYAAACRRLDDALRQMDPGNRKDKLFRRLARLCCRRLAGHYGHWPRALWHWLWSLSD